MSKKVKVSGLFVLCLMMITGCSQNNSATANSSHSNSTNGSSIPSLPNESTNSSSSSNEPEPIPYYTYRFYDAYNTIIKEDTIQEGEPIIPPKNNPEKKKTDQYSYQFVKWSLDDFSAITKNEDIYPIYNETINQYTYTFLNYDDSILKQVTADYGTKIVPPENPTYEEDNDLIYTFVGWDQQFSILTKDITIKAQYQIQTDVQKKALRIVRSAFENNQVISVLVTLQGNINTTIQMQFSIDDTTLNQLLTSQIVSIEQLLQSVTLKAIIHYNQEDILIEINPNRSYVSYQNKVYQIDLLKTYQTLVEVLPKDVFDIVSFLEQLMKHEIPIQNLEVTETLQEAFILISIDCSDFATPFSINENQFQCEAIFTKQNDAYLFKTANMSLFNENIEVSLLEEDFVFEMNHDSALQWLDHLLAFAQPISKTAQLQDFHLTGVIHLSGLGLAKVDITFDIKISIDTNQQVYAVLDLNMAPNWLGSTIVKENTHSLVYIDQSQNKIYLNRTTKEVLKKSWTFEEFQADIANNIFDILNASDLVRNNGDAQASVQFSELIKDITLNEEQNILTITINKDAITLIKEGSSLGISKDFVLSIQTNEEGYLSTLSLTGAVSMSGLSLDISLQNAALIDIGQSLNVAQIIQEALEAGTIQH
ncbi:putative uncharacterized protein [Firmicutes bacterium CAG:631]|nr:putative uncharacterized protein [Firmicutes bacterium CAG:631]